MATGRWNELKSLARQIPGVSVKEADHTITFSTGGSIRVRSGQDPQSLRGEAYHLVVIDEAAFFPDLETLWLQVLRPALSDRQGRALFISTPGGKNYYWQLWNTGNDPLQTEWRSWQLPTSTNPHIKASEIESARANLTDRAFKQEYLAEFLSDGGAVFSHVAQVSILQSQDGPIAGHSYTFGVDWGRVNDATSITVFDATARQQVYLDRFIGVGWELQRNRLKALYEHWRPDVIIAEENSIGGPNIEALQRDGIPVRPFTTTAQSKAVLIEGLALAIERGYLGETDGAKFLADPVQVGELINYTMQQTTGGRFSYSAPIGLHDDTVISLALAIYGARTSRAVFGMFANRHVADVQDYNADHDLYWSWWDSEPRCVLVGQVDPAGAIRVLAEYYDVDQPDHGVTIAAVRALGYKTSSLVFIPEGAEVLRRHLWTASIVHTRVVLALEESIKHIRALLQSNRLYINPRCQRLIGEVRAFAYADNNRPLDMGSSGPLALAQLCWKLRYNGTTGVSVSVGNNPARSM